MGSITGIVVEVKLIGASFVVGVNRVSGGYRGINQEVTVA